MDKKNNLVFDSNNKKTAKIKKSTIDKNTLQYSKPEKKKKKVNIEKTKSIKSQNKHQKPKLTKKERLIYNVKVVLISMIGLFLSGAVIFGIIIANWMSDLPELDTSLLTQVSQSSLIYDKNGELVTTYSSYENREWASIDEVPENLKNAILAIEDHDFYNHNGIYFKRLAGAILGQITGANDYGGSTITQQLIKNVYLSSEVTYKRKAQEIVLALKLEKEMTKDEILEAYMNIIYLGGSNYGIKAAAKDYFGKSLDELTLRECAIIAGLAKNPNGYNPRKNMQKGDMTPTNERADNVLWAMHEQGKITDEEYNNALVEEVEVKESSPYSEMYPYAHFVEYVLDEVAEDLLVQEGKEATNENITYKKYAIRNGGYKIYTTLDVNAQNILQEEASTFTMYPETEDGNGTQVSAVIIDQHTGEITAMIGSKDEPTALETFNRAVDSTQPIGSIMKPIAIFAPSIEKGLSPASVVADYQSPIQGYDINNSYPGGTCSNSPSTMRLAVQNSHNIPAARFLMDYVGIETASDYLVRMGVNESHISKTGSGIALGTSDATTLEITGAFATLANDGTYIEPHSYRKVLNRKDEEVLSSDTKVSRQVFKESTAWMTTDMLISEVESGSGTRAKINGITTAGKTGTHEDKCITFAGYTGYYTSVIRISSDSYSSMYNASGGNQTARLWHNYMTRIHEGLEDKQIQAKSAEELNIKQYTVCNISGNLATNACVEAGHAITDYFLEGTQPKDYCDMHIKICPYNDCLASDGCPYATVATYISPDNYLYDIDHNILENSLETVVFDLRFEDCWHTSYIPEPNPEPIAPEEPETSEESEIPSEEIPSEEIPPEEIPPEEIPPEEIPDEPSENPGETPEETDETQTINENNNE